MSAARLDCRHGGGLAIPEAGHVGGIADERHIGRLTHGAYEGQSSTSVAVTAVAIYERSW